MAHVIEPASTARSRCRGCGTRIERGALRFGERIPNPFADGETTLWLHLPCAAFKRPEALLEALGEAGDEVPDRAVLAERARFGVDHRRLPRIDGAERSPTGQAKCRSCHEPIGKGTWRIRLVFWEEGRFVPSGFVHLGCREEHFETKDVLERLFFFSPDLDDEARADLARACDETA
jgi:hypothetical protein